jgi:hypothetical protein
VILHPKQFADAIRTLGGYVADDAWHHIAKRVMGGAKTDADVFGTLHFSPGESAEIKARAARRAS